jgi:predicted DNA-binding protein
LSPKIGRPTEDPKIYETRIRMSSQDVKLLNYCCEKTGMTKADVIRQGIREVYAKIKE